MFGYRSSRGRRRGWGRRGRTGFPGLTLVELSQGESASIASFAGGRHCREKMSSMGLFPGTEVTVVKGGGEDGMMLVSVGSVRIMLDVVMASRILVEKAG